MHINSKIQWHPGMELTADVFRQMDEAFDLKQSVVLRAAVGGASMGIVPGCEFKADGAFVGRKYEIVPLKCTAFLPSGRIISVDEDMSVEIGKIEDDELFLCIAADFRNDYLYQAGGVPYRRPVYSLVLLNSSEMESGDFFPIKRFVLHDGVLDTDSDFIVPSVLLESNPAFESFRGRFCEILEGLAGHANIASGECRASLASYLFRLRHFNMHRKVADLIDFLQEIAASLDFYLYGMMGSTLEAVPEDARQLNSTDGRNFKVYDINSYLNWICSYSVSLKDVADNCVLNDKPIDLEAIKREISEELYEKLRNEIFDKLHSALSSELYDAIWDKVIEQLNTHLKDVVVPHLKEELFLEIKTPLYSELYNLLYRALWDALGKKEESVVDEFMPLI